MAVRRDDFVLKEIEKFGDLIRNFFGIKKEEDFQEEMNKISRAYKEEEIVELEIFKHLSEEELIKEFNNNRFTSVKWKLIAAYLNKLGEDGDERVFIKSKSKALMILLHVYFETHNTLSIELLFKIEQLINELEDHSVLYGLNIMIFDFFVLNSKWAKAEDILFKIVSEGNYQVEIQKIGNDFYNRLLQLDDESLNAGELPRAEVLQGKSDFDKLIKNFG